MNARANKLLLLGSSVATLAALGWGAYRENVLQEWRVVQREYKRRLSAANAAEFNVQLRQIVVPDLNAADRCVSCHVGMAPGETGVAGSALFAHHPNVVHDPGEFGCTVCHGGQGRATERAAAHGDAPHWPEPMIPRRYIAAGCGSCHTPLEVPRLAALERGRSLVERYDCLACHKLDGRGGSTRPGGAGGMEGPDLSRVGAVGFDRDWYAHHLARRDTSRVGAWRASFAEIAGEDREPIEALLLSRVGAADLVEAKSVFHSRGCLGCHKVGGVGGDDGPDLTSIGKMDPGQRDFSHVEGAHTVANWLAEHFRKPSAVVPASAMPEFRLSEKDLDALVFHMLSLRRGSLPEAYWPLDRVRGERFGAREFSTDGATLFGAFCAACHGPTGEGMRYPGMVAFPAIGNPEFLRIASDAFLKATVTHGRRPRRMPAGGESAGGLRPAEIDSVVAHVRTLGGGARPLDDAKPARWVAGDVRIGAALYAANCGACHGKKGEGGEGTALANATLLQNATDTYLVETIRRGRRGSSMLGFGTGSATRRALLQEEIEAVVAHIRSWEAHP